MSNLKCFPLFFLACCTFVFVHDQSTAQTANEGIAQAEKRHAKPKPKSPVKNGLSQQPAGISEFSSDNFLLRTDLPADDAKQLLERLEKMLGLVAKYYSKPNSQTIEMNVIQNKNNWLTGSIPDVALNSILNEAGITLSATVSQQNDLGEKQITAAKSIVWAVSTRGVPQHEAVHAYCHQNFGRVGPTWYAEGMAELGQYWTDKSDGIRIHDEVMQYLRTSEPKSLAEITAPGQKTGDSWKNYAWRWALCQLLSTNPNYAPRFKPLGMAFLTDQRTSFQDVYGSMSKEISFEYLLFLKQMNQGYRSDLCAWDWKAKFQRLRGTATVQVKVVANRGWQASRVRVTTGDKISFTSAGEWNLGMDGPIVGADGDKNGRGQLEGVLFTEYELTEPFTLGASGEYEAETTGNLYLRCRDDWCQIADNTGAITVKLKSAP